MRTPLAVALQQVSIAPAAEEAVIPGIAGRSLRVFTGWDDWTIPLERWHSAGWTTISPKDVRSIMFNDSGAAITFGENPKWPYYAEIPGLTKSRFAQAVASHGDLIDLTPQGMHSIGIDILTEKEWDTMSRFHLRSRIWDHKPNDPFINDSFRRIEANPALLKTPESHPELAEEFRLELQRRQAEMARYSLVRSGGRLGAASAEEGAVAEESAVEAGEGLGSRLIIGAVSQMTTALKFMGQEPVRVDPDPAVLAAGSSVQLG